MNRVVKARDKILTTLDKLSKFCDTINENTKQNDIVVRMEILQPLWTEFHDLESKLSDDVESKEDEFIELFFRIKSIFLSALKPSVSQERGNNNPVLIEQLFEQQRIFLAGLSEHTAALSNASMNNTMLGANMSVRLPKISIEPFQGNYEAWPSFIDLFTSTVHENVTLSNAQKLQILKSLVKGGPADCIRDLLVTDANYDAALKKLKDRYSKKKVILSTLVSSFLDQPSASNGDAKSLRRLSDFSDEVLKGVAALGDKAADRDPWLLHILLQKVDVETQEAWALETVNEDFPTVEGLIDFLNKRCDVKESCALLNKKPNARSATVKSHHTQSQSSSTIECAACKNSHHLFRCHKFQRMPVENRWNLVKKIDGCFNCLRVGHDSASCAIEYRCKVCSQKHHSLLHSKSNDASAKQSSNSVSSSSSNSKPFAVNCVSLDDPVSENDNSNSQEISHNTLIDAISSRINACSPELQCLNAVANFQTLLPTALVFVRDISGQLQTARVLIDSASTASFVSDQFVNRLGLRKTHCHRLLTGIGNTPAGSAKGIVSLVLQSRINPECQIDVNALVLNKVTSLIPSDNVSIKSNYISKIKLADPTFHIPGTIDILLGAEKALHIFTGHKVSINRGVVALATIFGHVVGGQSNTFTQKTSSYKTITTSIDNLNTTLQLFWKLEDVPNHLNASDFNAEDHFSNNVTRSLDGKIIVKLPFRLNHASLGNSRKAAYCRLFAMERKFDKNPNFKHEYVKFMNEYLELGHMSAVPVSEIDCPDSSCYYLPHHAVIKADSVTTKLRVVFDGSCKSSSGVSLNEILHVGPIIQPDLVTTLVRFRSNAIAYTADVEKMYRQVLVQEDDKNFQRIVWRDDKTKPIHHFHLNTVTYGTSCAPFLAIRSLQMVANDSKIDNKLLEIIKSDFYVDDLLSGTESIEEAMQIIRNLSSTLESYGFRLRKWRSNSKKLLQSIPKNKTEENSLTLSESEASTVKTLGLHWNPARDEFHFQIDLPEESIMTKRKLVSQIARTFDPLGWLSPVTINMKSIVQQLWIEKLGWDDELSDPIMKKWMKIRMNLRQLESIGIPRYVFASSNVSHQSEIHAFCDASTTGYAAAVYIRSTESSGVSQVHLLIAKTKVAPLKPITIPKLELCGALTLANLILFLKSTKEYQDLPVTAWCDSQIVLAWLSSNPYKWEQFVGNRCGRILDILPRSNWHYIKSKDNPADIASRGILPDDIISNRQWWYGPAWLTQHKSNWPIIEAAICPEAEIAARKGKAVSCYSTTLNLNTTLEKLFEDCSTFSKIIRTIARILKLSPRKSKLDSIQLLRQSEIICYKYVQQQYFAEEIRCLRRMEPLPNKSKLSTLSPYIDEDNILRVKGRLKNALINTDAKHPVILPNQHAIASLIIRDAHLKFFHAGATLTSNIVKQKIWIIDCKNLTRRIVNSCMSCIRQRANNRSQLMGDLPEERVTPSRPFLNAGVDFAGPISIKSRLGRGNIQSTKGYIALFICQCTKAIHLELVSSLTSEAFIACLRRFISRRGIPSTILSDNGTNFVGAKHELHDLYVLFQSQNFYNSISDFLSQNEIKFDFIPPRSPHFGGLWEANIKCVKFHLKRVCNVTLTFEEMSTLLTEIEAVLNSRPYVSTSNDVQSLDALTPGHFLIGAPLVSIPEPNLETISENRLSRWQNVQSRVQSFWRRWSLEYLNTLQQRHKWKHQSPNINIDDIVIVKEDNLPPSQWLLGRIVQLHHGVDNLVRVATIKTKCGFYQRPIVKLCPLLSENEQQHKTPTNTATSTTT